MFKMLSHHVEEAGCVPFRSGGWVDHVHIVCGLSRTLTIAQLVEHVKTGTSTWAKKTANGIQDFSWQSGNGVFSISQSKLAQVVRYVDEQKEHHKQRPYQEEFRELCDKHGIKLDERYVWD